MNRMFRIFAVVTMFSVFFVTPAFAGGTLENQQFFTDGQVDYGKQDVQKQTDAFTGPNGANFGRVSDPRVMAMRIVESFLFALGTIFFAYMVYAGYLLLTSAGVEDRVDKAKKIIRNSIIGIILVLSAYSLTWIVRWIFVASGDDTYKNCVPPASEEFINDPLSPQNTDAPFTNC